MSRRGLPNQKMPREEWRRLQLAGELKADQKGGFPKLGFSRAPAWCLIHDAPDAPVANVMFPKKLPTVRVRERDYIPATT